MSGIRMNASAALEGKRYPRLRFVVDAERVRAFARAVGHPGDGVPPTFVTAPELAVGLSNVVTDPQLGISLEQVLHGEQEYEWRRPLSVGEELTADATIERVRGKGGTWFVTLRTEFTDADGASVATGRCTLIVRDEA
jgi:acyl dehydratase